MHQMPPNGKFYLFYFIFFIIFIIMLGDKVSHHGKQFFLIGFQTIPGDILED